MTTAISARIFEPTPSHRLWCQYAVSSVHCAAKLCPAVARMRGSVTIVTSAVSSISGTTSSTQS